MEEQYDELINMNVVEKPWELTTEESLETQQKAKSRSFSKFAFEYRKSIAVAVSIIGVLIGIRVLLLGNRVEILISLNAIFITIAIIGEIIGKTRESEVKSKHQIPTYGIVALVFDILGMILILVIDVQGFMTFSIWVNLCAAPFGFIAIFCSLGGFYYENDSRPGMAILGLFLGSILLLISFWQVLLVILIIIGIIAYLYAEAN